MNFIKLDILVLLDQHKKITAVADALGVKQPTITFHMKSLEEQYGVPLFETYGGRYKLTRAGTALLHYARKIRALGLEAGRIMAEQRSPEKGIFHIGASYVAGTYFLPVWIHQFREAYPEVEVRLTIRTAPVIRQMLAERQIDIGFISAQKASTEDELYYEAICEDKLVVAYSVNHPLAKKNNIHQVITDCNDLTDGLTNITPNFSMHSNADKSTILPEELAAYPFLLHGSQSTTREMTNHWAQINNISFKNGIEMDSIESIKRTLVYGNNITFISYTAIQEEVAFGKLACEDIHKDLPQRMIFVCYNPERWISPQMNAFLEIIREQKPI